MPYLAWLGISSGGWLDTRALYIREPRQETSLHPLRKTSRTDDGCQRPRCGMVEQILQY